VVRSWQFVPEEVSGGLAFAVVELTRPAFGGDGLLDHIQATTMAERLG
jgi:hypothetical protein